MGPPRHFQSRSVEPQQALGVAGQDLLAFGVGAGQTADELPGEGLRRERVVGAEQQPVGAELGVAVLQRCQLVANGVDVNFACQ